MSVAQRLAALVAADDLRLPLPGSGATAERWEALAALSRENVVLGRLAEAHSDAAAILVELGARPVGVRELWGVWAAEPPAPVLEASSDGDGWSLTGQKPWCSGANSCTHALVTARVGEQRALFAVELDQLMVRPVPDTWPAVGMAESDSGTVTFNGACAVMVGTPGDYLSRPGFWHGAIGVAACWFGAACGVADELVSRAVRGGLDAHALAQLGRVSAALSGAQWALDGAAREVDQDPNDSASAAQPRAHRVRAIVEMAATETLDGVGRALGAGPLCANALHAGRVADLTVYLRQSHAERDLAVLGQLVADGGTPW